MKTILRFVLLLTLLTTISFADIIHVPADIDSIQGGINLANTGDTVLVQPGTYVENINFNGKNIVVGSLILTTHDTSYISQTVIDGDSIGSVVTFENGEDSTTVFCGFTITNGYGIGGGIHMYNSSPLVSQLNIINNSASNVPEPGGIPFGGGIYFENSNAQVSQVKVLSNSAAGHGGFGLTIGTGGGIYCFNSNPILTAMEIKDNLALGAGGGGGIYFKNSNPILTDIDIINNQGGNGGGISCENSNPIIQNTTVSSNEAIGVYATGAVGGGLGGGIFILDYSNPTLSNVLIFNNSADAGGGICCGEYWENDDDSNLSLSNVTIKNNTAGNFGGGICSSSLTRISFDNNNRCNIYLNTAIEFGNDLYTKSDSIIPVVVDTFTVLIPDSSHAYPLNKFTFDIRNAVVTNISKNPVSPTNFVLNQNYPNPFNPSTTIKFTLPKSEYVELKVFNILGKEVATLVSKKINQGNHTYTFDGENLASGVYYYQLVAGDYREVKKMILLK